MIAIDCRKKGRVYPRACGGTSRSSDRTGGHHGLSPRLRGNPPLHCPDVHRIGSIPAPAGEPRGQVRYSCDSRVYPAPAGEPPEHIVEVIQNQVYPRACGGTLGALFTYYPTAGLSPRLRGNRTFPSQYITLTWSIPAPAGEPYRLGYCIGCKWVYPRACGGTDTPCRAAMSFIGLSPRLRGNLAGTA